MKNITLLWIIALFLVIMTASVVSGADSEIDYYYPVDVMINITTSCFLTTGAYCSDTAECNLTVSDPNGAVVINNQNFTGNAGYYYYNYTPRMLGNYEVTTLCVDGADYGNDKFLFQVNRVGKELENFGIILFFIVGMFVIFLIITVMLILNKNFIAIPMTMLSSLMLTGVFFIYYMYSIILNSIALMLFRISLIFLLLVFLMNVVMMFMWAVRNFSRRRKENDFYQDFQ